MKYFLFCVSNFISVLEVLPKCLDSIFLLSLRKVKCQVFTYINFKKKLQILQNMIKTLTVGTSGLLHISCKEKQSHSEPQKLS